MANNSKGNSVVNGTIKTVDKGNSTGTVVLEGDRRESFSLQSFFSGSVVRQPRAEERVKVVLDSHNELVALLARQLD